MIKVEDIIKLLEEYGNVIKSINHSKLQNKLKAIDKSVSELKSLNNYIIDLKEASTKNSNVTNRIKKERATEVITVLRKITEGAILKDSEKEVMLEFESQNNEIYKLYSGEMSLEQFLGLKKFEDLTISELKMIYYIIFNDSKSGTKQDIISSLNKHLSRKEYYGAFEEKF